MWALATPGETTVYVICKGAGFDAAAKILGLDFAGVLVRDGWAVYRGFKKAPYQTCLAHLLRRCKNLQARSSRQLLGRRRAGLTACG